MEYTKVFQPWDLLNPRHELNSVTVSMNFKRGVYFQMSFTYAEAQMRIDDPSQDDEITQSLRHLNQLAKILKHKRIEQG